MDRADPSDPKLEPALLAWIEDAAGGPVASVRLAASGGRRGYRIDIERRGGNLPLYLQCGRPPGSGSFHPISREAEVFRAMEAIGVKVPHLWGVSSEHNVMLVDRLEGQVWFHEPQDAD